MKKLKMIALVLCTGLLLTGCGKIPTLANGEQVVAKIEGKDFTAEELYQELKSQGGSVVLQNMIDDFISNKEITDTKDAEEYAQGQIDYMKSSYEAQGLDFEKDLKGSQYKTEENFKNVIMKDYMRTEAGKKYIKDNLTEDEINNYYEKEIYGELTVKHILITPEVTDDMTDEQKKAAENDALEKAKGIINQLKNGDDFDELAKKYSDDEGSAQDGGLVSKFSKDSVVEQFWDASLNLKDGEMTNEPVKSTYGYHIIKRVSQEAKPAKKDVMDVIKDGLLDEKLAADSNAVEKAWIKLREAYKLDIVDTDIKNTYNTTVENMQ